MSNYQASNCYVCTEPLLPGDSVLIFPCKHTGVHPGCLYFHVKVQLAKKKTPTCPECRFEIKGLKVVCQDYDMEEAFWNFDEFVARFAKECADALGRLQEDSE